MFICAKLENSEYLFLGPCAEAQMFSQYYIATIPRHETLEWSGNNNHLAEQIARTQLTYWKTSGTDNRQRVCEITS